MKRFVLSITFLLLVSSFALAQEGQDFIYDDKGKRDPFSPLVDANGQYVSEEGLLYSFDELNLSGILWDPEGKSSALINNQIVKVGGLVFGFTVKNITRDTVTISRDNKEYILRLSVEKERR